MTNYEYKVIEYNGHKKIIKKMLSKSFGKYLLCTIGEDATKLLHFIDELYRAKLAVKPKKHASFRSIIKFTTEFVKENTGLSPIRQRKALSILYDAALIDIYYFLPPLISDYKQRHIDYLYKNFGEFIKIINKNRLILSHINYHPKDSRVLKLLDPDETSFSFGYTPSNKDKKPTYTFDDDEEEIEDDPEYNDSKIIKA